MYMPCSYSPVALLPHLSRMPVGYFPQADNLWAFKSGGKECVVVHDEGDIIVLERSQNERN